jgi:tryptophan-rich sensory protein
MEKLNWKVYTLSIFIAELVGILAAIITKDGISTYSMLVEKVWFSPPAMVFPIVWTILYALMGISAARVWLAEESPERTHALRIYLVQLVVNFFWSIIFFNAEAYGLAVIWILILWLLIIAMIKAFMKVDKFAAKLQIPYLVWVTFATVLTIGIWIVNK